jgi:Kelch motif
LKLKSPLPVKILCVLAITVFAEGCTNWTLTGSMAVPRFRHTATLLLDGSVLVAGGTDGTNVWNSSERYNPVSGKWTVAASMQFPRVAHTATRLLDGRVLVVGGLQDVVGVPLRQTDSAEIYDPVKDQWIVVAPMHVARAYHLAEMLLDGQVLVVNGGPTGSVAEQRSVELYNAATNTWDSVGSTTMGHAEGTITRLTDGSILVAGGLEFGTEAKNPPIYASNYSEHYVPDSGVGHWGEVSVMNELPSSQAASILHDGTVLVTGGTTPGGTVRSTVRYHEPATLASFQANVWQYSQDMFSVRSRHTQTTMVDGTVLVVGGYLGCIQTQPTAGCTTSTNLVEVFQPTDSVSGVWANADYLNVPRGGHTATLLGGNQCKILVAGGYEWGNNVALSSAELYPTPCFQK